jgi:hypothetical protein
MSRFVERRIGIGILALVAVCAGCGKADEVQRVPMQGKVSLNGDPLNAPQRLFSDVLFGMRGRG